jgi:exopolysaccharide production protein ExoZ
LVSTAVCALSREGQGPPTLIGRMMVSAGDASYSIYLTHSFLLGPAGRVWGKLFGAGLDGVFVILMLAGSIGVGLLSYRFVEQPLLRHLKRQPTK